MDPSTPSSTTAVESVANVAASGDTKQFDLRSESGNPSASPPKITGTTPPPTILPATSTIVLQPQPTNGNTISSANSNTRLRSSIACVRCRKSKIKCTNSGAGTTCEACAHSNRECIYPAPGTGGVKRETDGEDTGERTKRPRARKSDSLVEKSSPGFSYTNGDHGRVQVKSQPSAHFSIKLNSFEPPSIPGRIWSEIFDLFQLNYGTELPFLHAPTFLPRLADDPVQYAALTGHKEDLKSLQLLQFGILTLTARHHEGLQRQHSGDPRAGLTHHTAFSTSEHYAVNLKGLLFEEDVLSPASQFDSPTLPMVQALLMLSLYEWSVRRGKSAWTYLGIAIRMAQVMEIFNEDLDILTLSFASSLGSKTSSLLHAATHVNDGELSDGFVQEESIRRTVWSCFTLDRYLSNGATRPFGIEVERLQVQMPCGDNAWTFGERVCTPYFNGSCSKHLERTKWKSVHSGKDAYESRDARMSPAMVDNMMSKIQCEYDKDEGINSRYVKLTDIWGRIARWSYQGGKNSENNAQWYDNRSKYWDLKMDLHRFVEDMPRSFQFTKANSQAHLSRHSSPPYTLLHTLFSICKLVMLKEFLPFSPVNISSPSQLDEVEIREPNNFNLKCYSNALVDLFKTAHDILELLQICKTRGVLPNGPMMAFGIYLVSYVGVYATHFPHMDSEGWIAGKEVAPDRHSRITECINLLVTAKTQLPVAEYLFRTLHRTHKYYKQINQDTKPNQFSAVNRHSPSAQSHASESIRYLDDVFGEFGVPEDESIRFVLSKEEIFTPGEIIPESLISPQPMWQPVKSLPSSTRKLDPLDRAAPTVGPQGHAKWYQAWGDPSSSSKSSSAYDGGRTYGLPPNTLPPINSPPAGGIHPYASNAPSAHLSKPSQIDKMLFVSGGDVAIFVDARNDKDLDTIKAGWRLIKDDKDPGITGSPNYRAQETKRAQVMGTSWLGIVWQWS